MDVRLAQANPSSQPAFTIDSAVTSTRFGVPPGSTHRRAADVQSAEPAAVPTGAVPFVGDYIDLTMSPSIKLDDNGVWVFNIDPTTNAGGFAVWTDNRNVRAGPGGNLTDYTPPQSPSRGTDKHLDPGRRCRSASRRRPARATRTSSARGSITGLFATALGNAKPLDATAQRAFALLIENTTDRTRSYRLTIRSQPVGGQASFRQFGAPLPALDVAIPRFSTAARCQRPGAERDGGHTSGRKRNLG